jgi:hypothetical protein
LRRMRASRAPFRCWKWSPMVSLVLDIVGRAEDSAFVAV